MGEEARQGWANTKLFSEIVTNFGWKQCGPLDRDVVFASQSPASKPRTEKVGVDALFRFDCPITGTKRAVLVDGKRYAMSSMSSSTLSEIVRGVVKSADRLRHAGDVLVEERGISREHILDTAIIAWDCHDGWDSVRGRRMIASVDMSQRKNPPVLALVITKDHLDTLETLRSIAEKAGHLEFYYRNGRPSAAYSKVLVPELLVSSVIPMRTSSPKQDHVGEQTGFLVPDVDAFSQADFPLELASMLGLFHPRELTVWVCCSRIKHEDFVEKVNNAIRQIQANNDALILPTLKFVHVPRTPFSS